MYIVHMPILRFDDLGHVAKLEKNLSCRAATCSHPKLLNPVHAIVSRTLMPCKCTMKSAEELTKMMVWVTSISHLNATTPVSGLDGTLTLIFIIDILKRYILSQ